MFNLVKSEMYRAVHTRSWWITLLVAAALIFCVMYLMSALGAEAQPADPAGDFQNGFSAGITGGQSAPDNGLHIEVGASVNAEAAQTTQMPDATLSDWLKVMGSGGVMMMVLAVFTALFAAAEEKDGYIKNIAGHFPHRGKMAAAKLTVLAAYTTVLLGLITVCVYAAGCLFLPAKPILDAAVSLRALGVFWVVHFAFSVLVLLLVQLTRSAAVGIAAGILMPSGIMDMLFSLLDKLLHTLGVPETFASCIYFPTGGLNYYCSDGRNGALICVVSCLVWAVLAAAGAAMLLQKRDVN